MHMNSINSNFWRYWAPFPPIVFVVHFLILLLNMKNSEKSVQGSMDSYLSGMYTFLGITLIHIFSLMKNGDINEDS